MTATAKSSSAAKEQILSRIREALPGEALDPRASYDRIARLHTRSGSLSHEHILELLIDRLLDYDTEVIQLDAHAELDTALADAVASALNHKGESRLLTPSDFPLSWLPTTCKVIYDEQLTTAQLDAESAVITTCEAAVASTGTIFLVHAGTQGRRVATLLPDHHICLLRRDQVVETIAEAIELIAPHSTKPLTTISGPSATSDIEMTRIRGVHGPRRLTVILYGTN